MPQEFFPKNYNALLIKDMANCALTSSGSVGVEYPCFGIPSITASDSFYHGLGFSYDAKDKDQYFDFLQNMPKIVSKKLTEEQIDLARISFYFYNGGTKLDHPLLHQYDISRKIDLNFFFDKSSELIHKYKEDDDIFKKYLKIQLTNGDRNMTII